MSNISQDDVTLLLSAVRGGEEDALERFFAVVYDDLQRVARRRLGPARVGQTLNTVALVHETYLKPVDRAKALPEDRLAAMDARLAEVVELRFYGGLTASAPTGPNTWLPPVATTRSCAVRWSGC